MTEKNAAAHSQTHPNSVVGYLRNVGHAVGKQEIKNVLSSWGGPDQQQDFEKAILLNLIEIEEKFITDGLTTYRLTAKGKAYE